MNKHKPLQIPSRKRRKLIKERKEGSLEGGGGEGGGACGTIIELRGELAFRPAKCARVDRFELIIGANLREFERH
jgi:hypothetical protein